MDELQLIRGFRTPVPPAPEATRRRARELLAERFEHGERGFGSPRLDGRHVLVWAALLLLAALLAGSALAFGDRLLDVIRGKPAPTSVRREFAQLDPHALIPYFDYPTVIKNRIRGVLAFDTAAGPVGLWAGPTRNGGTCFVFRKLRPKTLVDRVPVAAGCVGPRVPGGLALGATFVAPVAEKLRFAWGYAAKNVATVEVHPRRRQGQTGPVYERFFAVGAPATTSLVSAVGFDRDGQEVGRCCPLPPVPPASPPAPARTGPYRTVFDVVNQQAVFPRGRGRPAHPPRAPAVGFRRARRQRAGGRDAASRSLRVQGAAEAAPAQVRYFNSTVAPASLSAPEPD